MVLSRFIHLLVTSWSFQLFRLSNLQPIVREGGWQFRWCNLQFQVIAVRIAGKRWWNMPDHTEAGSWPSWLGLLG